MTGVPEPTAGNRAIAAAARIVGGVRVGKDRLAKNDEVATTDAAGSAGAVLIVGESLSPPTKAEARFSLQPVRRV